MVNTVMALLELRCRVGRRYTTFRSVCLEVSDDEARLESLSRRRALRGKGQRRLAISRHSCAGEGAVREPGGWRHRRRLSRLVSGRSSRSGHGGAGVRGRELWGKPHWSRNMQLTRITVDPNQMGGV